jgi:hypothetical protein
MNAIVLRAQDWVNVQGVIHNALRRWTVSFKAARDRPMMEVGGGSRLPGASHAPAGIRPFPSISSTPPS